MINTIQSIHSSSAICFLTRQPSAETIQFAIQLANNISSIDVFIMVDDNQYTYVSNSSSSIQFLQFNDTVCTKYGFQGANHFGTRKSCSAWDKALYYFAQKTTHHSFVWFIEDDVFIPSTQAFLSLHELYSSSSDLVSPDMEYNLDGNIHNWFHWYSAPGKFVIPWAHGMVCAVGCSRRLLTAINEYVQWRGYLTFIEFLFHTLAIHDNQMAIVTPIELDTIVYRDTYSYEQIKARPYNWWHPIKNSNEREELRNRLAKNSSMDRNSILTLLNSIEQYLKDINVTNITEDVKRGIMDLPVQFELMKGQLTLRDRHQLRDPFLRLATNLSENLANTFVLLAHHALKLSENLTEKINKTNKTALHIKLEQAIENNKRGILHLMNNYNPTVDDMVTISWLRDETERLIRELTFEIQQCEQNSRCGRRTQWLELNNEINQYSTTNFTMQSILLTIVTLCVILLFFKLKQKYRY